MMVAPEYDGREWVEAKISQAKKRPDRAWSKGDGRAFIWAGGKISELEKESAKLKEQIGAAGSLIKTVLEQADDLINDYCSDDRHYYPEEGVEKLLGMLDDDSKLYGIFTEVVNDDS